MAIEITELDLERIRPLYAPWEKPWRHRAKGKIEPEVGRRPSPAALVPGLRSMVDDWRDAGYPGVTDTTRALLKHWFGSEHLDNGQTFHFHWAQREAIETVIYLYENRKHRNLSQLLLEYGGEQYWEVANGLDPRENAWARYCCKVATGGGKTIIMSLAIVWSFFNALYEESEDYAMHFVVIAPGVTVYERLKEDFGDGRIFYKEAFVPPEWRAEFNVGVVLQDEPGGTERRGTIYLSNIHRLYASRDAQRDDEETTSIFGPEVKKGAVYDGGASLRQRIAEHKRVMVLNDEAHHLHDADLAWNTAIETLDSQMKQVGGGGVLAQLDFSATPKHNDGKLFRHVICDFPLGEAVDAGIVKVPVIGESENLVPLTPEGSPAHERWRNHLKVGYERWKIVLDQIGKVRTPILFVMTEDTQSADEIKAFLDSDDFPELKGRVLNLHTKLKGRIKTVNRGGKKVQEFVENDDALRPEDLVELRKWSRELDSPESPFRCVVSVLMLREGWDVKNVTTIVPLRPYSADSNILPEQTLGRGLRRMFPGSEDPEIVSVVHHPQFKKLYDEELQQEGLDILVTRETFRESVTIFVDYERKPVADLDIVLPEVSQSIEETTTIDGLTFESLADQFRRVGSKLSIGEPKSGEFEYTERQLFNDDLVARMKLDLGLLERAWSAVEFYAKELELACKVPGKRAEIARLLQRFVEESLFERPVNLFSGDIDHRMREPDVASTIRATFAPVIKQLTVREQQRRTYGPSRRVSVWKPYQASISDKRPAIAAEKTMFNLVPCTFGLERRFAEFCDRAEDVVAFAKNGGPQKLSIDYLKSSNDRSFYWPDFFVRTSDGRNFLVELKGRSDSDVPRKAAAAVSWCNAAGKADKWEYVFLPEYLFESSAPSRSMAMVAQACKPALNQLLEELTHLQASLPLEEETAQQRKEDAFNQVLRTAGLSAVHESIARTCREAVSTLYFTIESDHERLSPGFQALLPEFDALAERCLLKRIRPHMPSDGYGQNHYFQVVPTGLKHGEVKRLQNFGENLRSLCVYGKPRFLFATLSFCLEYGLTWNDDQPGVWKDVHREFSGELALLVFDDLEEVVDFRNTWVAHGTANLRDEEQAKSAMAQWIRCLNNVLALV